MKLTPKSILTKATSARGGIVSAVVLTVALEFGTQFLVKLAGAKVAQDTAKPIVTNAPFLGVVSIRDSAVLAPSIFSIVRAATGKGKISLPFIIANYGTKVLLRRTGLNTGILEQRSAPTSYSGAGHNIIAVSSPPLG